MFPYRVAKRAWHRLNQEPKRILAWYVLRTKHTPPPDVYKQRFVQHTGKKFGLKTFIETGTYKGDMTAAASKVFDHVYSIELNRPFYEKATERFSDDDRVKILFGDSTTELRTLLNTIDEPCLFWLDAHGGFVAKNEDGSEKSAPVVSEIQTILSHDQKDNHVILVDDAHTFIADTKWGKGVWKQLEERRESWMREHSNWQWKVVDNILMIYRNKLTTASGGVPPAGGRN